LTYHDASVFLAMEVSSEERHRITSAKPSERQRSTAMLQTSYSIQPELSPKAG
jgi:hypothetical protein